MACAHLMLPPVQPSPAPQDTLHPTHAPPFCSFSNIRARIPFEDLPYPGPLVALCQDIAIARASGLLAAEERLYWKLIGERVKGGLGGRCGDQQAAERSQGCHPCWAVVCCATRVLAGVLCEHSHFNWTACYQSGIMDNQGEPNCCMLPQCTQTCIAPPRL